MKRLFLLLILLSICASGGEAKCADAGQDLLWQVAKRSAGIYTLHAQFTQEKKLSILDDSLVSSGQMCLERSRDDKMERVLWAYEKPVVSGFAYEGGVGWLWTDDRSRHHQAQGMEAVALKTITEQILTWVRVRPNALQEQYTMVRLPDAPDNAPVLRLSPRQNQNFFATLEVTFAPSLETVRSLRFVEKNGDTTTLTFEHTRTNAALPPQCRNSSNQ